MTIIRRLQGSGSRTGCPARSLYAFNPPDVSSTGPDEFALRLAEDDRDIVRILLSVPSLVAGMQNMSSIFLA